MKRRLCSIPVVMLACIVPAASAQQPRRDGQQRGLRVPMFWKSPRPLDPGKHYTLTGGRGREIPAQADDQNRLWWLGNPNRTRPLQLKEANAADAAPHVRVERAGEDQIHVTIDGEPFATFNFKKGESRPYLYPVIGPTGDPITRDYPMKLNPDEKAHKYQDHPHHRSLWTAHGDVRCADRPDDKIDYWGTERTHEVDGQPVVSYRGGNAGQQRVTRVRTVSGPVFGLIQAEVEWVTSDGHRQLTDTRTYRFFRGTNRQRIIDYELVLHFPDHDVTFKDTKEGGLLSVRLPYTMTERPGQGHMVNAKGQKGMEACWGQPADWCDYVGPVNGKTLGLAIFDAPSNFRHPTRWHIRDYGLYTANPFMALAVDKKNEDSSYTWKKGQSVTFNYRMVIHRGDTQEARIAEQYAAFARPSSVTVEP